MAFDIANPYFRNEVLTASPQKLRLLLLDGCLHFMREGRSALKTKDFERVYESFTSAKDIVLELMSGMDHAQAPEVCENLARLYTFVFTRLTEASFEKSIEKLDECLKIMMYERETWALVMARAAEELGTPEATTQTPTPTASQVPAQTGYRSKAARGDGGFSMSA